MTHEERNAIARRDRVYNAIGILNSLYGLVYLYLPLVFVAYGRLAWSFHLQLRNLAWSIVLKVQNRLVFLTYGSHLSGYSI